MGRGGGSHLYQGGTWHLQLQQQKEDMEGEHEKEELEVGLWGGEKQQCQPTHQYSSLGQVQVLGSMQTGDAVSDPCHPRWGSSSFPTADVSTGLCTPTPLLT